jgi:peptidoglycan/LPS O-acetylase OafA/YrhL
MDPVARLILPAVADILFVTFALVPGYGIGRALAARLALDARPGRAAFVMAALGASLGAASLLAFPLALAREPPARWAAFVIAPLLAGGAMAALGHLRRKHGGRPNAIENAAAGFSFALGFAAIRLAFAA